jgi:hypothetical protein
MRHMSAGGRYTGTVMATIAMVTLAAATVAARSDAQRAPAPATPVTNSVSGPRVVTATEKMRGLHLYGNLGAVSDDGTTRVADDRMDEQRPARVRAWLETVTTNPASGMQLDAVGVLSVVAGYDSVARQQFAKRLATPGLSVGDRAYTLLAGVEVFGADASKVERMQTALEYQRTLDGLPPSMVLAQFEGHAKLAEAYYNAGVSASVIHHLGRAFALTPNTLWDRRSWGLYRQYFLMLADALSGLPDGRRLIDSVATWMHPFTQAPPELRGNEIYDRWSQRNEWDFESMVQAASHLGREAPAIEAQFWLNTDVPATPSTSTPGAFKKTLADGRIRILEIGHYGCPGCLASLPRLERIRKTLAGAVETWFVTKEGDGWGATPCTPEEKMQHLKRFYDRKGYTLPIAIWIGPREPDVDGGSLPKKSPVVEAYQLIGTPTYVVTDARGIVRHIGLGDSEAQLLRVARYLVAESANRPQR